MGLGQLFMDYMSSLDNNPIALKLSKNKSRRFHPLKWH